MVTSSLVEPKSAAVSAQVSASRWLCGTVRVESWRSAANSSLMIPVAASAWPTVSRIAVSSSYAR